MGRVVSGPVASLRRPQDPALLLSNQSTTPVVFCDPGGGRPDVRPTPNRTIRLDPETVAALEAHRERQFVERDLAGDAYEDHDLIFCDELGRPINPQRLMQAFAALREAASIRPGRLHDVRHSHATHLLQHPVPVHVVSARLGHSSPVVTLTVYAHVLPTGDEQAATAFAQVL